MTLDVISWSERLAKNSVSRNGIDAWFVHTAHFPTKDFSQVALTSVLLSPAGDARTRSVWQALRSACVFETVQHRRFEDATSLEELESCLGNLPQITQVFVHAPDGGHDEIVLQLGKLLLRVGTTASILVTSNTGSFIPGYFKGCIRADQNILVLVTFSVFMMFQGIDTLEQMNGFAIYDVLDVLENASDDLRLVEAFWLPAGQKLVFLDEREAKYVECACALWVSIEGWLVRYSQINDILNSHPIRIGGKISDRVLVYNAHASQRYTTAMYGPVTRVRILCR